MGKPSNSSPVMVAAPPPSSKLGAWAHIATIASSVVAIAALAFGSYQFYETQKAQRESIALQKDSLEHERNAKAIELFVKYNELMLQPNASGSQIERKESRYWKQNLAVGLLESLFNLTRGSKEWEATVGWALERHGTFIRENRLSCMTYSGEFVAYLEKIFSAQPYSLCMDLHASE